MKTEKVLALLFILAVLSKIFHIPTAATQVILSTSVLACLYFVGGIYFFSDEKIKKNTAIYSIIYGMFLSVGCIGVLFKLEVWVGTFPILHIGWILSGVLLGIAIFQFRRASETVRYWRNMLWRTGVIFAITSILVALPTVEWVRLLTRNRPELQEVWINSLENPDCHSCKDELNRMLGFSEEP
jgi:hypothetical protein